MDFVDNSPPQNVVAPPSPVEKTGMMVKLGWNKTVLGADSWQPRYFRLTATGLSYAKSPDAPIIDNIVLHKGVECQIVDAGTPARRNRYENNDKGRARATSATSGPIGKDNCVEMLVPREVGKVLDISGSPQERMKQLQGRTYYFHCSSRKEAEEWKAAIMNNVKVMPGARVAGAVAAHILGTDVDNGSISAEELKTVMIEQYATFVAEVADRAMRILVRVKKLELAEEAQAALQQQFVDELTPLRGKVSLKKPERKTALVGKLADAIVDEVVLMIDEESKVSAGLIAKTAGAIFKAHHDKDVAILRAEAKDRVAEATAAHRAALAGKAAAGGSKKDKSSLAGDVAEAVGEEVGGRAADAAVDALTGLIPLPFAGAVIGAGIKHVVKKTAVAAATKKKYLAVLLKGAND